MPIRCGAGDVAGTEVPRETAQAPVRSSVQTVMAVLVVYESDPLHAKAWGRLCALAEAPADRCPLRLESVLVYDNSPDARVAAGSLPMWALHVHDPANGGTAAAYQRALQQASDRGCRWLLLLDDDTDIPADLLSRAAHALQRAQASVPAAAVLPRVMHGTAPISPAVVSALGSIRPLAPGASPEAAAALTGIASGALVRVDAFRRLGPLPSGLWLDYVDHWLFARLQERGRVLVSDALLQHDLSISEPGRVGDRRFASILAGEWEYVRALKLPARILHPLRLAWRAVRPSGLSLHQRLLIARFLARRLLPR